MGVYIEQEEVVNCEASSISVEFLSTSYSIRVETVPEPLVLGPVECGQVDIRASSWRLSQGKRLTISVVKARTNAAMSTKSEGRSSQAASESKPAAQEQGQGQGDGIGSILMWIMS